MEEHKVNAHDSELQNCLEKTATLQQNLDQLILDHEKEASLLQKKYNLLFANTTAENEIGAKLKSLNLREQQEREIFLRVVLHSTVYEKITSQLDALLQRYIQTTDNLHKTVEEERNSKTNLILESGRELAKIEQLIEKQIDSIVYSNDTSLSPLSGSLGEGSCGDMSEESLM